MLCAQKNWARLLKHYSVTLVGSFRASKSNNGNKMGNPASCSEDGGKNSSNLSNYNETYQKLQDLDFATAAKIIFSEPPKKKRFGFDFHLVQFFFACMPSLAVYLVAQYARYDMRKMEAEQEKKKKQQEEVEKAKALELEAAAEEEEAGSKRVIEEVKERLDRLEETMKAVVKSSNISNGKKDPAIIEQSRELPGPEALNKGSEPGISVEGLSVTKEGITSSEQVPAPSQKDRRAQYPKWGPLAISGFREVNGVLPLSSASDQECS